MSKSQNNDPTWWDWCTRLIAIAALGMGLFNLYQDRVKAKAARAIAAKEFYDKAWDQLGGTSGATVILQGEVATNSYARQRAMKLVEEGLVVAPDDPDLIATKGVIIAEQGNTQEAVRLFRQALALGPHDTAAHTGLGVILQDQGKTDEAIALYRQAIALQPADASLAYYNMGTAYREKRDLESSAAAFRKAISIRNDYAHAYHALAEILQAQGKTTEAAAFREKSSWLARVRQASAAKLTPIQPSPSMK